MAEDRQVAGVRPGRNFHLEVDVGHGRVLDKQGHDLTYFVKAPLSVIWRKD